MPITPISSDQNSNRASIVSDMLNRGGRSLSQMLAAEIQLGRNMVDNQLRQEQAFLTERRREINLNERRAEAKQQDFEDTRKFEEEKRRFDVKFGQSEEQFQVGVDQKEKDRALRARQVEGSLSLGAERNDISRTNSATSVVNAETSRMNAITSAASVAQQGEIARADRIFKSQNEARATKRQAALQGQIQGFGSIQDPQQRKTTALQIASSPDLDASTRNRFLSEAGIGVSTKQLSQLDTLDAPSRAKAEGTLKALTDLEIERDAELSKLTRRENEEPRFFEKRRQEASARFDKRRQELERRFNLQVGGGANSSPENTADGIFGNLEKKLGIGQ